MTASPTELWSEITGLIAEATEVRAKIDADLDALPCDPTASEVEAHLARCAPSYSQMSEVVERFGDVLADMSGRGLVEEIGGYLAVTYGGRP